MKIKVETTAIEDVKIINPEIFKDDRGFFFETFRSDQFERNNLPAKFVQQNHSGSVKNVIRGLHFQYQPLMGKMMRVTRGEAFLVAVDIRKGSPDFGKWIGVAVSEENRKQVWAPAGFARGFCVISDYAEIQYQCTGIYNSDGESGILWNDPAIGIEWPVNNPILSDKDKNAQTLKEWIGTSESEHLKFRG